ncbi:hypothetical protein PLICRDRAFT_110091 [Plicaturopsis crispa FD-325 SS-3]|nr:hypothetical protein PLICRDRAFT_110091 [Plicaturopsis crispa FD-325 SS-3]
MTGLHGTPTRYEISHLQMPAMSPTMTEGGIVEWKKKDGEAFVAGDVLLEIETDKATIDVEAPDDGVMGKILAPDGTKNIAVGKVIALLAEEGDDISNLQPPKESSPSPSQSPPQPQPQFPPTPSAPAPTPPPKAHTPLKHTHPLFPSVHRLLLEAGITDADTITGTGVRGMLTKGDVLTFLGKASGPLGTSKEASKSEVAAASAAKKVEGPLDGAAIRQQIVSAMLRASIRARAAVPGPVVEPDFDSVIADYLPPAPKSAATTPPPPVQGSGKSGSAGYLDGLI